MGGASGDAAGVVRKNGNRLQSMVRKICGDAEEDISPADVYQVAGTLRAPCIIGLRRSAPKRNAERMMPIAVVWPRSETAMAVKPVSALSKCLSGYR